MGDLDPHATHDGYLWGCKASEARDGTGSMDDIEVDHNSPLRQISGSEATFEPVSKMAR